MKDTVRWNIDEGRALTGTDVARALRQRTVLFHRAREFFDRYDALVLPVSQVVPFDVTMEYPTVIAGLPQHTYLDWMRSSYFVSMIGNPALAVPAGFTDDRLPVGVQIVGAHRGERALLELGRAFEVATAWNAQRPPIAELPPGRTETG